MITTVTMYRVVCDRPDCERSPSDGGDYHAWVEPEGAFCDLDYAYDWYTSQNVHLCPDHTPTCEIVDCSVRLTSDEFGARCEDHFDDPTAEPDDEWFIEPDDASVIGQPVTNKGGVGGG